MTKRGPGKADTARKQAQRDGERTYEGKPCPKGHTLRRTGSMDCVECALAYGRNRKKLAAHLACALAKLDDVEREKVKRMERDLRIAAAIQGKAKTFVKPKPVPFDEEEEL